MEHSIEERAAIFDGMANSTASYRVSSMLPETKKDWNEIGTLWTFSSPKKGKDQWRSYQQKAQEKTNNMGGIPKNAKLYGLYMIGKKALSETNSRPSEVSIEEFDKLCSDSNFVKQVETFREKAIEVASKL